MVPNIDTAEYFVGEGLGPVDDSHSCPRWNVCTARNTEDGLAD